jgi:hypothetical protein
MTNIILYSICLAFLLFPGSLYGQEKDVRVITTELPRRELRQRIESPTSGASYIAVAPQKFLPALLPLARLRQRLGETVVCVTLEALTQVFPVRREEALQKFLHHACSRWPLPRPRFVLLCSDIRTKTSGVPAIPTWYVRDYQGTPMASDYPYTKGDGVPNTLMVGRLPAQTLQELRDMCDKIVAYEKRQDPGLWQRRISLFAGPGGYGPVADILLESIASSLLAQNIPAGYDVAMSYAAPSSPYFFPPERFPELVTSRFQEGALFTVYIGHGNKDRFANFPYDGQRYPFFGNHEAKKLDIAAGLPVMVSLTCLNGCFDDNQDCLGESLIKCRRGPVAFIGASRISHPYGNVLLGQEFLHAIFAERRATLGETLARVRQGLVHPPLLDVKRYLIEQSVVYFGDEELPFATVRLDHVYMYNLLGDPATRIFFPDFSLDLSLTAQTAQMQSPPQNVWLVSGNDPRLVSCQELYVSLEVASDRLLPESLAIETEDLVQKYREANRKVIVSKTLKNPGRQWEMLLTSPPLPHGTYFVKVAAVTDKGLLSGWRAVEIKDKQEKE